MKQKLYIGLLIGGFLLTACSDDTGEKDFPSHLVRLNAGIVPNTRAALNQFDGETVAFAKASRPGDYTETWQAVATTTETSLQGKHAYPDDRSYLYLRGYYPVKTLASGAASYTLDGETDLMATIEQKGNLIDNFSLTEKTFYFNHLLTQITLEVRISSKETNRLRLVSVEMNGSRPEATVALAAAPADSLPKVIFAGTPAPLTAYIEPVRGGGEILSRQAFLLPRTLLVEPGAALTLNVKVGLPDGTTRAWSALPIRFYETDGLSRPGTAYRLTLTLYPSDSSPGGDGITITADVTPWASSGTGNGTVR